MLTIFGAVAELEREYIRQRQREGIEIAKEQGKYKGRPAKQLDQFESVYTQWKSGKITVTSASKQLGVSRSTFYRKVSEHEKMLSGKLNDAPSGILFRADLEFLQRCSSL